MIGTHTSKKRRDVPHIFFVEPKRKRFKGNIVDSRYKWVCEQGSHYANGSSAEDARRWFRMIYGY